ncbi:hypothetical protein DL93DRAFT_613244 [Clavulina sp. PMI_390]|nr:hypothetical protein DL93DRAFT_613244 [Clavulina sp. PMI_390]
MQVIRTYLDHADDTPVSWGEFNAAMSEEAAPLRSWVLEFQTCRENFPGSRDVKPKRGIKKESKAAEYSLRAFRPVVAQRFRDVPPPPPVIGSVDPTLTFSRLHISSIFHGSPQGMIIRPGRNKIPYLENEDSMFYDFQWNSWAPRLIGEHGLVFFYARFPGSGPVAIPNPGNGLTLFSFVSRNNWRYMGQYRGRRFEPLSGAEWKHLPYKTKVEWFREAQNNKRWRDLVDDSDAVGAPGSNHSDPEFRKFEAAMGEEVVRIDCWLMEFIRYRHDYIDALTGRVPKGKKEEKKESADPEVKVEDVDFEVELHLPSDIIPDSPRRSTRQRLKGKGWALEG